MDWATWLAVAWVGRRACCSFLPVGTWHTQQQVGMGWRRMETLWGRGVSSADPQNNWPLPWGLGAAEPS